MANDETNPNQAEAANVHLTPREREILALLGHGLHNKAIAARLAVHEQTIKNYVSIILGKLGVSNRTEAALWAARHGFLKSSENSDSQA